MLTTLVVLALCVPGLATAHQSDYFLFVREWSPSLCDVEKCSHEAVNHFTIHGLWPENFDASWPQYCSKQPFSAAAVSDLLPRLRHEWPSVFGKGAHFWQHEWRRHGTCATETFPTEHAFFGSVLDLHERYDPTAAMAAVGMHRDTEYDHDEVQAALSQALGSRVALHCDHGLASELWLCLKHDLTPFDCPENVERHCGRVTFPSAGGIGSAGNDQIKEAAV